MPPTRDLAVTKPIPPGTMSVAQLSALELRAELDRRVRGLRERRRQLLDEVAKIDAELGSLGEPLVKKPRRPRAEGEEARPPRRRAQNETPLPEVLATVLDGGAMTTRELADRALAAGYKTTAKKFTISVNTALHRDDRFEKVDGKWRLSPAES